MKLQFLIIITVIVFAVACKKNTVTQTINPPLVSDSYLPMHIGNYWRIGTGTSIDITDTTRIANHLYYKFYAKIGGDAFSTQYLRIDTANQLWEGYLSQPGKEYLHARFNGNLDEIFYTLNDQSVNDCKVRISGRTDHIRMFEFDRVYHQNLKGQLTTRTYLKGLGWGDDQWDSIRINGTIYRK